MVILGGGPSLTRADVEYVRQRHAEGQCKAIVINDGYRLALWADVLYAADIDWYAYHAQPRPENDQTPWTVFAGPKYSIERNKGVGDKYHKRFPEIEVLRNTGMHGLEKDPTAVRAGMNSGHQAINLAYHLGATRILLLGYDCKRTGGESHWFGHHPLNIRRESPYESFVNLFTLSAPEFAKAGLAIVNCSRETALECFPLASIEDALPVAVPV